MPEPLLSAKFFAEQFASAVGKSVLGKAGEIVFGSPEERAMRNVLARARRRRVEAHDSLDPMRSSHLDTLLGHLLEYPLLVEELVLVALSAKPMHAVDALVARAGEVQDIGTFPGDIHAELRELGRTLQAELRREASIAQSPLAPMIVQARLDELLELELGPAAVDPDDVARRAGANARHQYRELRDAAWLNRLPTESRLADSPLEGSWRTLLQTKPEWHAAVDVEIQGLTQSLKSIGHPGAQGALARSLERCLMVDTHDEYRVVRSAIRELLDEKTAVLADLRAWERELRDRDDRDAHRARKIVAPIYDRLAKLERHVRKPAYARCLLVAASSGEGKTHFLGERLLKAEHHSADLLVMVVRHPPSDTAGVPSALATAAEQATGFPWRNWEDLADLADEHWHWLVVAVDDLDRWDPDLVSVLQEQIARSTRHGSVRWIITSERNGLERLINGNWSWLDYATTQREPQQRGLTPRRRRPLDGWIVLDRLNIEHATGAEILRQLRGNSGASGLSDVREAAALQRLATPFTAWALQEIATELDEPLEDLLDLSSVEVLGRFWDMLLNKRFTDRPDCDVDQFKDAVVRAGEALQDVPAGPLPYALMSTAMGEAAFERALHVGLLVREDERDPLGRSTRVRLRYPFIWEYVIAVQLMDRHDGKPVPDVIQALEKSHAVQPRETLVQVVLLLADARGLGDIWEAALGCAGIPDAAVWLAAARAEATTRDSLLATAADAPRGTVDRRSTFALLRFLEAAGAGGASSASAVEAMACHYDSIRVHKLEEFFEYAVERLLDDVPTTDDLARCLRALVGSEAAGDPTQLALIAVGALRRLLPDVDGAIDASVAFLRAVTAPRLEASASESPRTFHEAYARIFARRLVDEEALHAYELLMTRGWYDGEPRGLPERMRSEANVALGDWYRAAWPEQRADYVDLVKNEAGVSGKPPPLRHRTNAIYLTKHSAPQREGKRGYLDEDFFPIVIKLRRDEALRDNPHTHREIHRLVSMMKANPVFRRADNLRR